MLSESKIGKVISSTAEICYRIMNSIRTVLIVVIFSFIIISGAIEIFLRYIPGLNSFTWIDEVLRYLNIWIVFLGASVAVQTGTHLCMNFFVQKLFPAKISIFISRIVLIIIIAVLMLLILISADKVIKTFNVVIQAAPISISVFYLAVPFGVLFMLIEYLVILLSGKHDANNNENKEEVK